MGCYKDDEPREMEFLAVDGSPKMTVELCSLVCKVHGYHYAGLQAGYNYILVWI